MIGRKLSHFKITAKLGEGGMGEIYRAEDTKLGRDVAIKVLPEACSSDPERLTRLAREAQAIAALDHPNIVTIYSLEEVDGVHFIVMQLAEGAPLGQEIPDGGMSLDRLLEIAIPLSGALAAAHDKGVIHRDLKPANIMLSADGRPRILDFGLAKIREEQAASGIESQLPTELQTTEGVVLGTIPYMSPEQAEGKPVDHLSDIFSLGVVLYEIATGQRPLGDHGG